jgi:triacylglycerol lipase
MKAACILFFRLIFISVFLFGGIISAADRNEPREVPNPRKKKIPRITLKNISPPFKDYDYYRDYKEYGFQFNATSFNIINAWWLAEASTLVYADENFVRTQFRRVGLRMVKFFDHQSTQCFVASNDKFAIIAFRGSEIWKRKGKFDLNKILADLKADVDIRLTDWPGGGKVHRGFKDALDEVWLELAVYIRRLKDQGCKIWITGHSLGAALATLAADRYANVQGVYTFGSPRVGDGAFKKNFDAEAYRIVNNQDIATRVPPPGWYKHVGDIKFIDGEGNIHDHIIEKEGLANQPRDELYGQETSNHPNKRDSASLIPQSFKDHVPLLYTIHLWNNVVDIPNY